MFILELDETVILEGFDETLGEGLEVGFEFEFIFKLVEEVGVYFFEPEVILAVEQVQGGILLSRLFFNQHYKLLIVELLFEVDVIDQGYDVGFCLILFLFGHFIIICSYLGLKARDVYWIFEFIFQKMR